MGLFRKKSSHGTGGNRHAYERDRVASATINTTLVSPIGGGGTRAGAVRLRARVRWALRAATPGDRVLPELLIIGAQKSGTSSLYSYLADHPSTAPAFQKEVHYFDANFHRGVRWYRSFFPTKRQLARRDVGHAIPFEASPYYLAHPLVPHRVRGLLPTTKLIVLLRDPISRAISHYHHEVSRGREQLPMGEAFAREFERTSADFERLSNEPLYMGREFRCFSYKSRGLYADQLKRWLNVFPREQLLVLDGDRFFRETSHSMSRVCDFLAIPSREPPSGFRVVGGRDYEDVDPEIRAGLSEFFAPHNDRLRDLLKEEFDWA